MVQLSLNKEITKTSIILEDDSQGTDVVLDGDLGLSCAPKIQHGDTNMFKSQDQSENRRLRHNT